MPGEGIDIAKMPGHWVLARLGKRVLRPGGVELTRWMIDSLGIGQDDRVVEFAPGMGRTAQLVLEQNPAVYTAVERDASATEIVQKWLNVDNIRRRVFNGSAQQSGLPDACASVLYVEAMLTMASTTHRKQIIEEAFRVLEPGGRFALHEVALTQATANAPGEADHVRKTLTHSIHHKVHPVLINQWIAMLEEAGFEIQKQKTAPMTLLEPSRIIRDEGLLGAARFLFRLLTRGPERRRVLEMRRAFRSVRPHMTALSLIAVKPS
ncbi:MAG TPA: SAM-dependent methyltransferase [Phycisphaerales bacterium]|nr:SAM-dependent methyltransferase [Phycisphaerales bacterium]|tara:strand:+ start:143 stop:937 length:795 start_codon:yes stop_codon:yes gene_type:complete